MFLFSIKFNTQKKKNLFCSKFKPGGIHKQKAFTSGYLINWEITAGNI